MWDLNQHYQARGCPNPRRLVACCAVTLQFDILHTKARVLDGRHRTAFRVYACGRFGRSETVRQHTDWENTQPTSAPRSSTVVEGGS